MSSNTKVYEEKMKSSVEHLGRELAAVRAGRANPAVLDKVTVDYYGAPTPIQQVASVAVSEARTLTITPWDRTLLRAISKAIMASDVGINPIDDGQTIRLNFPAPTEERRKQLAKEVSKLGEEAKVAVRNIRRDANNKLDRDEELTEDEVNKLNDDLNRLLDMLDERPEIRVTYFVPDKRKSGGSYQTKTGIVRIYDGYTNELVFMDKTRIAVEDMCLVEFVEERGEIQ